MAALRSGALLTARPRPRRPALDPLGRMLRTCYRRAAMWWMSIVGPVLLALIWLATGRRDQRREGEIDRWRRTMGPRVVEKERAGYRSGKQIGKPGPGAKIVSALPGPLQRVIDAAGGGDAVGHYELVPKLAYLSAMAANLVTGSDLQAVTGKLEDDAPAFIVRPVPLIEVEGAASNGIEFKKDPEFTALFQVEPIAATNAPPPRPGSKEAKTPPSPRPSKPRRSGAGSRAPSATRSAICRTRGSTFRGGPWRSSSTGRPTRPSSTSW